MKKDRTTVQNISSHYSLVAKIIAKTSSEKGFATGNSRDVSLDTVKGFREQNRMTGHPAWVSSKTSRRWRYRLQSWLPEVTGQRGRRLHRWRAFCCRQADKPVRDSLGVCRPRGRHRIRQRRQEIYCLHSQGENQGLRLSRVDNVTWKQTHGLSLPLVKELPIWQRTLDSAKWERPIRIIAP